MNKLVYFVFLFTSYLNFAQQDAGWLRHSSISPDGSQIVFTYKGDLYKVAAQGGDAQQLTFHKALGFWSVSQSFSK